MRLFNEFTGLKVLAALLLPQQDSEYLKCKLIEEQVATSKNYTLKNLFGQTVLALKQAGWQVLNYVTRVYEKGYGLRVDVTGLDGFHLICIESQVAQNSAML